MYKLWMIDWLIDAISTININVVFDWPLPCMFEWRTLFAADKVIFHIFTLSWTKPVFLSVTNVEQTSSKGPKTHNYSCWLLAHNVVSPTYQQKSIALAKNKVLSKNNLHSFQTKKGRLCWDIHIKWLIIPSVYGFVILKWI